MPSQSIVRPKNSRNTIEFIVREPFNAGKGAAFDCGLCIQ